MRCLFGAALILPGGCRRVPESPGPVIGVVQVVSSAPLDDARHGFLKALADSGFVPGKTFTLIERNAQGDIPALSLIANEFLQRGVTQIGTISSVATQAAIKVITDRPVVFGAVANPYIIGAGTSPAEHRPNVTGASATIPLDSTLALAIEAFPEIKTWGTLFDPSDPFAEFYVGMAIKAANRLGVKFVTVACTSSSDIITGVHALQSQGAGGIMQIPSIMIGGGMPALVKAARELNVVVVSTTPGIAGAPLALGISFDDNGYAMGLAMIRVLRGENPATIPFQTAVRSQMHVDLAAAKAFGVTISPAIIARANVVLPVTGSTTVSTAQAPGSRSSPWALWLATLAQGLAYIALAWGVYLSSRVLRFPDITPDGSLPLGAAVAATLILAGVHPVLATLAAFFAGMWQDMSPACSILASVSPSCSPASW